MELLERMKSEGLKMDRMTYGVVMFLYSRKGDWQECLRLNDQMEAVRAVTAKAGCPHRQRPRAEAIGTDRMWPFLYSLVRLFIHLVILFSSALIDIIFV